MNVPPAFPVQYPNHSPYGESVIPDQETIIHDTSQSNWFQNVAERLNKDNRNNGDNMSWSAYVANLQDLTPRPPAITGLYPLFRDSAHSLDMVKHDMDLIRKAT